MTGQNPFDGSTAGSFEIETMLDEKAVAGTVRGRKLSFLGPSSIARAVDDIDIDSRRESLHMEEEEWTDEDTQEIIGSISYGSGKNRFQRSK